jgi:hypothetical protein
LFGLKDWCDRQFAEEGSILKIVLIELAGLFFLPTGLRRPKPAWRQTGLWRRAAGRGDFFWPPKKSYRGKMQ